MAYKLYLICIYVIKFNKMQKIWLSKRYFIADIYSTTNNNLLKPSIHSCPSLLGLGAKDLRF